MRESALPLCRFVNYETAMVLTLVRNVSVSIETVSVSGSEPDRGNDRFSSVSVPFEATDTMKRNRSLAPTIRATRYVNCLCGFAGVRREDTKDMNCVYFFQSASSETVPRSMMTGGTTAGSHLSIRLNHAVLNTRTRAKEVPNHQIIVTISPLFSRP